MHKNIITFEGFSIENGYPSIVTEWADGGTVIQYIKLHEKCDLIEIVSDYASPVMMSLLISAKASGIADGLNYLHDRLVIHADLKGVCHITALIDASVKGLKVLLG